MVVIFLSICAAFLVELVAIAVAVNSVLFVDVVMFANISSVDNISSVTFMNPLSVVSITAVVLVFDGVPSLKFVNAVSLAE